MVVPASLQVNFFFLMVLFFDRAGERWGALAALARWLRGHDVRVRSLRSALPRRRALTRRSVALRSGHDAFRLCLVLSASYVALLDMSRVSPSSCRVPSHP